jgi:hypothetical protein
MIHQDLAAAAVEWGNAQAGTDAATVRPDAAETPVVASLPDGNALPADTSAPAATSAPETHAPSTPAETFDMIEALLGDVSTPLRADLLIPLDVNGQQQMVPLSEVRRGGMREADYTRKTQALAEERKANSARERELAIAHATTEAIKAEMHEERQRLVRASEDPDEYQRYINHVQLLEADPTYKQTWELAQRAKIRDATDAAEATISADEQRNAVVQDISDTAEAYAKMPQFAGVSVEDAIAVYTQRVNANEADLTTRDLRQAFADIAAQRETIVSPLTTRMTEQDRVIADLQAQLAAMNANTTIRQRMPGRTSAATVPATQPNRANPVAPVSDRNAGRRTRSLDEAASEWSRT